MSTIKEKKGKKEKLQDKRQTVIEKKTNVKMDKIKIIRAAIFILIGLVIITSICYIIYLGYVTIKYSAYKQKMNYYQYEALYNNGKATSIQKVTKSELVKMMVCVMLNDNDVPREYAYSEKTYNNQDFVEYAEMIGLVNKGDITKENENKIATKNEAYKYINYLYDAETYDTASKKNDKRLIKGELNKLVVNLIEKYKTMYYNKTNENINLVTKKNKMPKNYDIYPYIIDSIPNEIYETSFNIKDEENYLSPKQVFSKRRYMYSAIDETITNYYKNVLNVDYSSINIESFVNSFKDLMVYGINESDVKDYVEYVKKNKIKLEGKATPLLPIIYNNGIQNVVRVKLEFKVLSSDTKDNILFGDSNEGANITYSNKEYTMYEDIELGNLLNSWSLRMYIHSPAENLIKQVEGITVKD